MIRHAVASDSAAIARVQNQSWRATYQGIIASQTLAQLSDEQSTRGWLRWFVSRPMDSLFLVATNPGDDKSSEIIGYSMARPAQSSGPPIARAEIQVLYLAPDFTRSGHGRQLMAASAIGLEKLGFRSLQIWSLADNPSRQFYNKLGGTIFGKRKTRVAGQVLDEVCYYWPTLSPLIAMRRQSIAQ